MQSLLSEALDIQQEAQTQGFNLKLLGGLAVKATCPSWQVLAELMGRGESEDIDFIGIGRQRKDLQSWFESLGFEMDEAVRHSQEYEVNRFILGGPGKPKIDVFFDRLEMAHTINFQDRLGEPGPTVEIVDLLLTKLQIHEFTKHDLIDTAILLVDHDPLEDQSQSNYFSRLMSSDWGFYHSATRNLQVLATSDLAKQIGESNHQTLTKRLQDLQRASDEFPRALSWKVRSKIGTKIRWYQEVEEA
jgi:hypothetical protein